jgi:uncharacterized membrane-anchored protein YhcB (DUF1043 family)
LSLFSDYWLLAGAALVLGIVAGYLAEPAGE